MGVSPECVGAVIAASGNRMNEAEAAELIRYTETLRRAEEAGGNLDGLDARVRQRAAESAERAQIAAAIAKKHAALSAIAYKQGLDHINGLVASGLDRRRAMLAFLEGTSRNVGEGRVSVAATALAYRTRFLRLIHDAVVRDPELRAMVEGGDTASAEAVLREMWELREGGKPGRTGHAKAAELARIYAEAAEASRIDLNRLGGTIGKLDGWTPQLHASDRVVKVDRDEWVAFILPRLDRDKTFPGQGDELARLHLRDIYDRIVTGIDRNGSPAGETGRVGGPANLANSLSASRVLHFTDADAWLQYRERFGSGHIHDAMLGHLMAAAKAAGQMEKLGPNPGNTLTRLRAELQRQAATDANLAPQQRQRQARALSPANTGGTIESAWGEISGLTAVPVDLRTAQIGTQIRAWQAMSKLGGAVISAITDLPVRAAALRYQGKSVFAAGTENIGEFFRGRGSTADQRRIAAQLGAGVDGVMSHITARWGAEDMPLGQWHKAQEAFFRLSGLTWWTDAMKAGSARMLSRWMADNAGLTWDGLGEPYRRVLRQHGLSAAEWDAIRSTAWQADDGARYVTPDRLAQLPRAVLAGLARERLEGMQAGLAAKTAERANRTATEAGWVQRRVEKFRESLATSQASFARRSKERAAGAEAKVAKARDAMAEVEARLSELAEFHQAAAEGRLWQEAAPDAPAPRLLPDADRWDAGGYARMTDGTTDLAHIPDGIEGVEALPVRLNRGTQDAAGKGYGLAHIEARRVGQIKGDMAEFIADVAGNFDQIRKGNNDALLLVRRLDEAKGDTLVVALNRNTGGFYEVITAGRFRESYMKKGRLLWEGERRSLPADNEAGSLQRGDQSPTNMGDRLVDRNINPETGEPRRPFQSKAEDWLDAPLADRVLRAQGEERARLDRLRRAIGNVRRAAKGADLRELDAFEAHWAEKESELNAFTLQMERRARQREALNAADSLEWGGRVEQALADQARALDIKLRRFFADEMGFAVIESDAQARRMSNFGTNPGWWGGELVRYLMQFKSFPIAFTNRVIGRSIHGYGPGERMLQGRNAGVLLAGLITAGYAAMTAKDFARGQAPRDPTKPATWLAVLVQSGGAGIYGDFLFGQASRFGNSTLETLAGPTAGAAASLANLGLKLRDGDAKAGEALHVGLQNTPFINLWYTRPVLDFLVLNAAREALSPGFLKRQQDARRKDFGQERLYPPTAFAF